MAAAGSIVCQGPIVSVVVHLNTLSPTKPRFIRWHPHVRGWRQHTATGFCNLVISSNRQVQAQSGRVSSLLALPCGIDTSVTAP